MNSIVFIAASSRYFEQYNWRNLIVNNFKKVIITGSELNKDYPVDQIHICPINQIKGEPNAYFDYESIKLIIDNLSKSNDKIILTCIDEANILNVAKLREHFNFSGPKVKDVFPFTNKAIMYDLLTKYNIRIPKSYVINNQKFNDLKKILGIPFIIKPQSSSGAFGVELIESYNDFTNIKLNKKFNYIASEYIKGELYHCDLQYKEGQVVFSSVGHYLNPLFEFLQGKNIGSIVLRLDSTERYLITSFSDYIIRKLCKNPTGSFHIEIFINNKNELVFLEAAYRPPGGAIIPLYEKAYGVNLCNQDIYILLGKNIPNIQYLNPHFIVAAPTKKGKIKGIINPKISSTFNIRKYINIGERFDSPNSIADKALKLDAYNDNYEQLYKDYLSLKDHNFLK